MLGLLQLCGFGLQQYIEISLHCFVSYGRRRCSRSRAIDPHDVAATCLFLAENRAVNGVTLAVDNGQHLVPMERDVMFAVNTLNTQATHG